MRFFNLHGGINNRSLRHQLAKAPPALFVIAGFMISYLLFFIYPIFFNPEHFMRMFEYFPRMHPIGFDLKQMISYSASYFVSAGTPYIGANLYPPLATVLFGPFILAPFHSAYAIMTAITLISFLVCAIIVPQLTSPERWLSPLLLLITATGLFSYGFQLELERGQFNEISMALALGSIAIFHRREKYRFLAFGLFTLSIQLKIFPAIFLLMFIRGGDTGVKNIRRLLGLGIANLLLLFVLGPRIFIDFISALKINTLHPDVNIWIGNHSIKSFITLQFINSPWKDMVSGPAQVALYVCVFACLALVAQQAYRRKNNSINPYLLLACTVAAMLIPSISHDYKLPILAAPVAMVLCGFRFGPAEGVGQRAVSAFLITILSIAYSSTLFPYANKPVLLYNNLPALMVVLLIAVLLSIREHPEKSGRDSYHHTG